MSTNTVGEFLVSLGWESNKQEQNEFEDAIQRATLKAKLLADGLEELARKAIDSVGNIAGEFDRLYFQATRTNTAASTIGDFVKVMVQAGVSADAAEGSVKSMTDKLRAGHVAVQDLNRMGWGLNPLTHQWEVQKEYLVNMSKMTDAYLVAGANLVSMDVEVARAEKRLGASLVDEIAKIEDFRKSLGFDEAQANKDGHKLAETWRETKDRLETITDMIGAGMSKALIGPLEQFNDFLKAHADDIGKDITIIMEALLKMTTAWTKDLEEWTKDPHALDGFSKDMHDIAVAIAALASDFEGFIANVRWLNNEGNRIADVLNHLVGGKQDGPGWVDNFSAEAAKRHLQEEAAEPPSMWKSFKDGARRMLGLPTSYGDSGPVGGGHAAKGALAVNQGEAYRAARAEGLSDMAARAVVANLSGESLATPADKHWDGSHFSQGIASWDDVRSEAIKAQFGKYPREMSVPDQVKAHIWEMKNNPRYAATWTALQGSDPDAMIGKLVRNYEAPANPDADIAKRTGHYNNLPANLGAVPSASIPSDAKDYAGIPLSADAIAGGSSNPGIIALARHIQETEAVRQFSAFNDGAHGPGGRVENANSYHRRGLAFDVTTRDADYEGSRIRTRDYLTRLGLTEAGMGDRPGDFAIEPGTRDHMHVEFKTAEAAQRYLELTGGAKKQAAPSVALGFKSPGAVGGDLLGGVKPTLGGAAGTTSSTTIHAPTETKIVINGSGDPTPSAHMVGAGITQKPADLTSNLQGATQ